MHDKLDALLKKAILIQGIYSNTLVQTQLIFYLPYHTKKSEVSLAPKRRVVSSAYGFCALSNNLFESKSLED